MVKGREEGERGIGGMEEKRSFVLESKLYYF